MKVDVNNIEDLWEKNLSVYNKILTSLAKRKNSENTQWCEWNDSRYPIYAICYICNLKFYSVETLRLHGYNHVKESNLLPFI